MEVILDAGTGWPVRDDPAISLGAVVDEMRRQAEERKRIAVSFLLDGEPLTPGVLEIVKDRPAREFDLLEVKTIDPQSLAFSTASDLLSYLRRLERSHQEGMSLVRANDPAAAAEMFRRCLDEWEVFAHAVRDIARLAKGDFHAISQWSVTLEERLRRQEEVLSRVRGAIDGQAHSRLGPMVEKEVVPLLSEWTSVLETLAASLTRLGGSGA